MVYDFIVGVTLYKVITFRMRFRTVYMKISGLYYNRVVVPVVDNVRLKWFVICITHIVCIVVQAKVIHGYRLGFICLYLKNIKHSNRKLIPHDYWIWYDNRIWMTWCRNGPFCLNGRWYTNDFYSSSCWSCRVWNPCGWTPRQHRVYSLLGSTSHTSICKLVIGY